MIADYRTRADFRLRIVSNSIVTLVNGLLDVNFNCFLILLATLFLSLILVALQGGVTSLICRVVISDLFSGLRRDIHAFLIN